MCDRHRCILLSEGKIMNEKLQEENKVLTDEELSVVSGGVEPSKKLICPKCGGVDIEPADSHSLPFVNLKICKCKSCGHRFYIER